ncbi:FAD-binding domain-containing protein [Eremomyces bilateralis CBS 781.70]|uniref:FAD-binding domain-containing protein n=1 Tax=Eremomyces bilateralis CBS 781.70 TaxID=1392243 RepID=A0A6G1GHA4_9PEZI|nr:FAD-binding domain-containing protein [Eremomyces bilateralis CBS 781.70]KAF1817433.1 FAD-binding domain-containing protein [Eremomyces bilateralis CBS 781.70]
MRLAFWSALIVWGIRPIYGLPGQHVLKQSEEEDVRKACHSLALGIGRDSVFFQNDQQYKYQQRDYWYQQQRNLHPKCRVLPRTTEEVRKAISAVTEYSAPFAVSSGKLGNAQSVSNVDRGITIDLGRLESIELADDGKSVTLGPGARWIDVYRHLEHFRLGVNGARDGFVGVGGYVLGGGLSWYASYSGWTCDTVIEFEVVLANGLIVTADASHYSDLFWALKGGGNNFGIVTKITLPTFGLCSVFGGYMLFDQELMEVDDLLYNFRRFNNETLPNTRVGGFLQFATIFGGGTSEEGVAFAYVDAEDGTADVANRYFHEPVLQNRTHITSLSEMSRFISEIVYRPLHKVRFTLTLLNDEVLLTIYNIFSRWSRRLKKEETLQILAMGLHPLTESHLSHGNNPLGLRAQDSPLVMIDVELHWLQSGLDRYYENLGWLIYLEMRYAAKTRGSFHPFVNMNYAAKWQDPVKSYGEENIQRMMSIREAYDPTRVFTRFLKGGFKV